MSGNEITRPSITINGDSGHSASSRVGSVGLVSGYQPYRVTIRPVRISGTSPYVGMLHIPA